MCGFAWSLTHRALTPNNIPFFFLPRDRLTEVASLLRQLLRQLCKACCLNASTGVKRRGKKTRDFTNEIRKETRTAEGCWVVWEMYKHTRPSEKKIILPTALLLKSSARISVFLHWAMSHRLLLNISVAHTAFKSCSFCGRAFIVPIMT